MAQMYRWPMYTISTNPPIIHTDESVRIHMLLYFFAVSSSSFFSPFVAALLAYDDAWMTNGNQTMINKYIAELDQPTQIEPL